MALAEVGDVPVRFIAGLCSTTYRFRLPRLEGGADPPGGELFLTYALAVCGGQRVDGRTSVGLPGSGDVRSEQFERRMDALERRVKAVAVAQCAVVLGIFAALIVRT